MDKFAMIIFGASGDLTKRKLMPALYSLFREKRLTGDFHILGIGRTIYSDEDYRSYISGELRTFVKSEEQDAALMEAFISHLCYLPMDPAKEEGYAMLRQRLVELTNEVDPDNLLFYLATPPSLYGVVPLHLKALEQELYRLRRNYRCRESGNRATWRILRNGGSFAGYGTESFDSACSSYCYGTSCYLQCG